MRDAQVCAQARNVYYADNMSVGHPPGHAAGFRGISGTSERNVRAIAASWVLARLCSSAGDGGVGMDWSPCAASERGVAALLSARLREAASRCDT